MNNKFKFGVLSLIIAMQGFSALLAAPLTNEQLQNNSKKNLVFLSELVTRDTPGHAVDIATDISGAEKLVLAVTEGGDNYTLDHSAWLEPRLTGPNGELKLTDLDWAMANAGHSEVRKNQGSDGRPIKVLGVSPSYGIGTHSASVIIYYIPKGYDRFLAKGAINDSAGTQGGGATVQFAVFTDIPDEKQQSMLRIREVQQFLLTEEFHRNKLQLKEIPESLMNEYTYIRNEMSDSMFNSIYDRKTRTAQSFNVNAAVLETDRDPADIVVRRLRALNNDIQSSVPGDLVSHLSELEKRNIATDINDFAARFAIFQNAVSLRDRIALCNPLLDFDKLLFIKRHHGKYTHMCDQYFGYHAKHGGGLFILDKPFSPNPVLHELTKDAVVESGRLKGQKLTGSVLSPELSYDGKTIFFAHTEAAGPKNEEEQRSFNRIHIPIKELETYTEIECQPKWSPDNTYHIFKINTDGSGLAQLTDGPWNEFDPCEMPDGKILFISERRGGYGRCHPRRCPSYTLHTMKNDGSDITCISYHESNEWHPSINNDGMVVYTRWDYWDRGFNQAHHPWITTPDGLDARAIQGNYGRTQQYRPLMEMDVRAIPGSHKYITTAAPHHGYAFGSLVVLDPRVEDDDAMAPLARLTPEIPFPEVENKGGYPKHYGTPWPLSEKYYLCAFAPDGSRHGIYLVDCFGNRTLIYDDPSIRSISPIPLRTRNKPPVIPPTTLAYDKSADMSPVGVINVYDTRTPFPDGTKITHLRIMQALPKATPIHNAPRIGYGADKGSRIVIGTVPVEEDGSAYFMLPTKKMFFFQALNEDGLAVLSMRSDTYVLPGQRLTCQGCHEPRNRTSAPRTSQPKAFRREASVIKPDIEGSNPFSFPILVQDVLDRNCVTCHDKNKDKKAPDLKKGNFTENPWHWYTSYMNLKQYAFFYGGAPSYENYPSDQYDGWTAPRTIPGEYGALGSKLYQQLAKGHHDLKLSKEDMHRITLWLDSNSDFFGSFDNIIEQSRGDIVRASLE